MKKLLPLKTVFTKNYPEDRIDGVTQEKYERIKVRNKEIYDLEKIVF